MKSSLRPAEYDDYGWICAAYKEAWPVGIVTDHDVKLWMTKWIERGEPECQVLMVDGAPVGLITWATRWFTGYIWNVLIAPEHQGKGYFTEMKRLARIELEARGIVVVTFKAAEDTIIEGRYPEDTIKMGDPL